MRANKSKVVGVASVGRAAKVNELQGVNARIDMQVVIKDKDGNVKYQGPLSMDIIKESDHGSDPR